MFIAAESLNSLLCRLLTKGAYRRYFLNFHNGDEFFAQNVCTVFPIADTCRICALILCDNRMVSMSIASTPRLHQDDIRYILFMGWFTPLSRVA